MSVYEHTAIEAAHALELALAAAGEPSPTPRVAARILWPALGCPAVLAPRQGAAGGAAAGVQHRVCVLLLSDRERLTPADAAAHLRIVPWAQRTRRHIRPGEPGTFGAADLQVRSDVPAGTLTRPQRDKHADAIAFGGDRYEDGVVVSLARRVRRFYADRGLRHLHEIRVSEAACARLADGQYHLLWNGQDAGEGSSSDEMRMLIDGFAVPRRRGQGRTEGWRQFFRRHEGFLVDEYRFDFGALHRPYHARDPERRRTEVLHPVFVRRGPDPLTLAHVTDTHLDTRLDVYEENLKRHGTPMAWDGRQLSYRGRELRFNNWNESFVRVYEEAKANAKAILMTGDLIDYGRGHVGLIENGAYRHRLADDEAYHEDRNWFLFYYLLASGERYSQPVYTILGNHDWRLNPYPPFAPGAPNPRELIHNYYWDERVDGPAPTHDWRREVVEIAHGPGHQQRIPMYARPPAWYVPGAAFDRLDFPGSPLQTTDESVAWYLLLINPFLDYGLPLPGGQRLLMLDWAEDEEITDADWLRRGTPRPKDSLTALQQRHVTEFARAPGGAKIVGIHTPPLGPASSWADEDLQRGAVTYANRRLMRLEDGTRTEISSHTLFASRPRNAPIGTAAEYGSLPRHRAWLVDQLAAPASGVRLVLSGHIHREGLLVAFPAPDGNGRLLRSVRSAEVPGAGPRTAAIRRGPPTAANPRGDVAGAAYPSPLYVNTGSTGPRGSQYLRAGETSVPPRFTVATLRGDGVIAGLHRPQLVVAAQPPGQGPPAAQPAAVQAHRPRHASAFPSHPQPRELEPTR